MLKKTCSVAAIALILAGCHSNTMNPQAARVRISSNPPAKNCTFKGAVTSQSTTFLSSDKNLEQDAMNDMRIQAAKMGANYVQIPATASGGYNEKQTAMTVNGNAYHCPYLD
jgi:uncharacterized protein DUF4156